WAGPFVAMATMTDTCRRTRSAASAGSRLTPEFFLAKNLSGTQSRFLKIPKFWEWYACTYGSAGGGPSGFTGKRYRVGGAPSEHAFCFDAGVGAKLKCQINFGFDPRGVGRSAHRHRISSHRRPRQELAQAI